MENITGCILLGGESKRMGGGIKSLKYFNKKTILDRIIEKSISQVSNLAINCNIENIAIVKYNLPIFSDVIKGYLGPLAGIHASLNWAIHNNPRHNWVFTFAGDSPFFPNNIVEKLYSKAIKKNKKIIFANSSGRNHPVFGIWHISLEKDLANAIINKKIYKIEKWAESHKYEVVKFIDKKYDPFFNINCHDDLIKAEIIENQILYK